MSRRVAIAIVGYRNVDDILRCLAALEQSVYSDFAVYVRENGGAAARDSLVSRAPAALTGGQRVDILTGHDNVGFAGGVNACLGASPDAHAWWLLNPDTEPHAEALAEMVGRLETGDCDAVGCTVYLPNGRVQAHGGRWRAWFARAESLGYGQPLSAPVNVARLERSQNYLLGASMLVGRRFLAATGPMREDYFLYCEEVEWCLRAIRRGLRLGFAPGARVRHASGSTTGAGRSVKDRPRLPVYLGERNRLLLTRDCFPGRMAPAALAALALIAFRYGRAGAWPQLGFALEGWCSGLRDERGPPGSA